MGEVQGSPAPPWSDLPCELLGLVFLRLPKRADRAFFTAVCRAWCSAARQCRLAPPSPVPWLVLPDGSAASFPHGETFQLPKGVRYHTSCGEWLFLSRRDGCCFLMDHFTKATMPLPSLSSYSYYQEHVEVDEDTVLAPDTWMDYKDAGEISVLSLVVCSPRLVAAILNVGDLGTIALCRPGAAAWSVSAHIGSLWLSHMVVFQGKLYAIDMYGAEDLITINIVDENDNDEPRVSRIERVFIGVPIKSQFTYLVESRGRLLMIYRKINFCRQRNSSLLVAGSSKFEVFEADFGRKLWTELRSLGDDLALFVGRGCSRAVCVSPYDLSRDSIFFVDDYISSIWKKTTTYCSVYDMKDKKVYPTLPMVSWMNGDIPATWLFCEESTTNRLQFTGDHLQEHVDTDEEDHGSFLPGGISGSSASSTTTC